jgi:hypothetical protein
MGVVLEMVDGVVVQSVSFLTLVFNPILRTTTYLSITSPLSFCLVFYSRQDGKNEPRGKNYHIKNRKEKTPHQSKILMTLE